MIQNLDLTLATSFDNLGIDDGSPRQTPAVRAAPELSKQSEEEIIRVSIEQHTDV